MIDFLIKIKIKLWKKVYYIQLNKIDFFFQLLEDFKTKKKKPNMCRILKVKQQQINSTFWFIDIKVHIFNGALKVLARASETITSEIPSLI